MGHALNKILKDLVVKSHNMLGFDAPHIPGWDCHGLPIELKGRPRARPGKAPDDYGRLPPGLPRLCREARRDPAARLQAARRARQVDEPYKTLDVHLPGVDRGALGKFVEQDMVYKGKKPVHWCTHCRTALAEAEVEYEPHTSPSIYVEFPMKEESVAEFWQRVCRTACGPDLQVRRLQSPS